tara:strand:- start:34 stop:495 length:462 start_codon:yes stop_codon:yes gene_type:complete
MTLSFSCSSADTRKFICANVSEEGFFFEESWEDENCFNPSGRWVAQTFGYMYFPIEYSFYGYYSYSLNIFLDLGEEAILSVERTMNSYEYGDVYGYSNEYTGTWSSEGDQVNIRIDDNLFLEMLCTLEEPMLSCEVSDTYISTATFERSSSSL